MAAGGCIYIQMAPGAAVGGPPPASVPQQTLGIGLSVGSLAVADQYLDPGNYLGANLSLRMSPMLAIELAVGGASLPDTLVGGDLTVTPATASIVFSLPAMYGYGPNQSCCYWRFGLGAGAAGLSHSVDVVDDSVAVVVFQMGADWTIPGLGRIFMVVDALAGDLVLDQTTAEYIDLRSMAVLRVGAEIDF